MQDVHPADCFKITDFPQINLCCLQVLMPQDYFRYYFEWNPVSAGICRRISPEIMRCHLLASSSASPAYGAISFRSLLLTAALSVESEMAQEAV
jgi:hypothetical protein